MKMKIAQIQAHVYEEKAKIWKNWSGIWNV